MKILFVQKVKALVGSEKYFLKLIPELEKRGIQTEFVCIYSEIDKDKTVPFIEAYKHLGYPLHVCAIKNEKQLLKSVRFIRKIVEKGNFDLIHSHLIHADLWCALLKKIYRIKIPIVSTKHGYDEDYISKHGFSAKNIIKNRYYKICKFSEKSIHLSFAVSEGLRNLFIQSGISDKNKIQTIHHGFDLPDVTNKQNSAFRFSPHQIVILGRIIPFKGHMHLMRALPLIQQQITDVKLVILGHGDEDLIKEIQDFSAQNNLEDHLEFLGYQPNIYDYLVNSEVMVVPSISEGFGLIFLEAMNSKLPIVGFDVSATNEIIVHNESGVLVPPYDHEKLAEEIITLLQDESKRIKLAENAFERLKTHFSLERMVTQTIQFYQDSLAAYSSRGKSK